MLALPSFFRIFFELQYHKGWKRMEEVEKREELNQGGFICFQIQ